MDLNINTGIAPFKASIRSVVIARIFEPDLNTFVAPILPDPCFVISILLKYLDKMYPLGNDPIK